MGRRDDLGASLERKLDLAGRSQIAEDPIGVASEGDPLHGVRQVPVEAGEEAEAVLGREVPRAALMPATPPPRTMTFIPAILAAIGRRCRSAGCPLRGRRRRR